MSHLQSCTLIPKEVTWVSTIATEVPQSALSKRYQRSGGRLLRMTSVVDSKNKKTLATATACAGKFPSIESRPNIEIAELELYDYRDWGSRHFYRVIVDNEHLLELGTDVVLDCGLNASINEGLIKGPFVFARTQTGVRLVRVDGPLYNQAIEYMERQKQVIPHKDLKYGHLYQAVANTRFVYLGDAETVDTYWDYKAQRNELRHYEGSLVYESALMGDSCSFNEMLDQGRLNYGFHIRSSVRVARDLGEVDGLPSQAVLYQRMRDEQSRDYLSNKTTYVYWGAHLRLKGSTDLPSKEVVDLVKAKHGAYPAGYVL